jgi:GrpB-like predicted nucleotidyltransferase (UPF0157 family)
MTKPIGPYHSAPVECHDYDPRAREVALKISELIESRMPEMKVEHVGSTAVPGCAGKGVVDLMVLYPEGGLERIKNLLDEFGFKPQTTRDPFPEDRPMRTGSFEFSGTVFRLHAHVVSENAAEAFDFRLFRDALRTDPALRAAYEALKLELISAGITDGVDYAEAKTDFVKKVLSKP